MRHFQRANNPPKRGVVPTLQLEPDQNQTTAFWIGLVPALPSHVFGLISGFAKLCGATGERARRRHTPSGAGVGCAR